MKLAELLGTPASVEAEIDITGLSDDSRTVEAGDAFIAVTGHKESGLGYVNEAVAQGACVVLTELPFDGDVGVPVVQVNNLSQQRGDIAANFFGHPGRSVRCLGITGTNGKTSVAFYTASTLEQLGECGGYMGTVGWGRVSQLQASGMTTVGAIQTQARLASLRGQGCGWAALEVSSHALAQGRVAAVPFEVALFTNLSRDHLDYHRSMAEYGAAKRRLFEQPGLALGVVNADDAFGEGLARDFKPRYPIITFGRRGDVRWDALHFDRSGVRGAWHTPWGDHRFELPLIGEFSVANAAASLAALCGLGFDFKDVVEAQRKLVGVPGRMEFIPMRSGPAAVIDYAHTPDALATVLPALRRHCQGELICVVGCGGDRDPGKRPLMASVAEQAADVIWLTSDNPRSEDPEQILDDMRAGLSGDGCVFECVDRAEAIRRALACAGEDDIVLVAGKGHEDYQELAEGRVPFSDRGVVLELAHERAG